jgi:hypothetical protein
MSHTHYLWLPHYSINLHCQQMQEVGINAKNRLKSIPKLSQIMDLNALLFEPDPT